MSDTYYVDLDGNKKIFCAEWKGGEKGTILGVHGLTANHGHHVCMAEHLSPDYRYIAIDVLGRGNSSPADEESSIDKHADYIIALIEKLKLERPIVIGHSMGAWISSTLASKYHKLGGLVMVDGGGDFAKNTVKDIGPALVRLNEEFKSVDQYEENIKTKYATMSVPYNKYLKYTTLHEITEVKPGVLKYKGKPEPILKDMESCANFNAEKVLSTIQCPVLFVWCNGVMMGGKPLFEEWQGDKIKKYVKDLTYFPSEANHFTIMTTEQISFIKMVEYFISTKCK